MKLFGKERKLFNFNKDGKGVKKEPEGPKDLKHFFKYFGNKFSRLISVNALMVFGNFPIFFAMIALGQFFDRPSSAPAFKLFAPLHGVMLHGQSAVTSALFGIYGAQSPISFMTVTSKVFLGLSLLVLFTFGFVNIGTTYILRNMVKGEPIFFWSDFKYAIKRNLRQSFLMGIFDLILTFLSVYNVYFYYLNIGSTFMNIMFFAGLLLAILWFWMRFYIYLIMVTFDLSIFKILKNALIFAIIGFKRNFMATLGIAAMLFATYLLMMIWFPLGIVVPFVLLFGDCAFMSCYAAFPKIKEIMIDPYYQEEEKEYEEPVFQDRG